MQSIVNQCGFNPEIIDFANKGQVELYSILRPLKFNNFKTSVKSIYKRLMDVLLYRRSKQNWVSYEKYITKYLNISEVTYSDNGLLIEAMMDYGQYITGSDQVWNVTIDDYDDAYFLSFVQNHPKTAYAVSQGAKDINRYARNPRQIAQYVQAINHVSVREENGQKWLRELTGKEYPLVLDPTLLLNKDVYSHIEEWHGIEAIGSEDYIFVYASPLSKKYLRMIRRFAKKNKLKIVFWHSQIWLKRLGLLKGIYCPREQNPGKYLDLIKNATIVCTSSFHGVAFSTIYRKNFVVLENDGMRAGDDDRMTGFLRRMKLSGRIVNTVTFDDTMKQIVDYSGFEIELKKEQKHSFEFLSRALGAEKTE